MDETQPLGRHSFPGKLSETVYMVWAIVQSLHVGNVLSVVPVCVVLSFLQMPTYSYIVVSMMIGESLIMFQTAIWAEP